MPSPIANPCLADFFAAVNSLVDKPSTKR